MVAVPLGADDLLQVEREHGYTVAVLGVLQDQLAGQDATTDTLPLGRQDVRGCMLDDRAALPPRHWFVRGTGREPARIAQGSQQRAHHVRVVAQQVSHGRPPSRRCALELPPPVPACAGSASSARPQPTTARCSLRWSWSTSQIRTNTVSSQALTLSTRAGGLHCSRHSASEMLWITAPPRCR